MAKKKAPQKPEPNQEPTPSWTLVVVRMDKALSFPEGWDQKYLKEEHISQLRDYLRDKQGAGPIQTEKHHTSNKIEGKPRRRRTAIFFVHNVTEGELVADNAVIPPRKGQFVLLPAGTDFKIKATTQHREIIEFTF